MWVLIRDIMPVYGYACDIWYILWLPHYFLLVRIYHSVTCIRSFPWKPHGACFWAFRDVGSIQVFDLGQAVCLITWQIRNLKRVFYWKQGKKGWSQFKHIGYSDKVQFWIDTSAINWNVPTKHWVWYRRTLLLILPEPFLLFIHFVILVSCLGVFSCCTALIQPLGTWHFNRIDNQIVGIKFTL